MTRLNLSDSSVSSETCGRKSLKSTRTLTMRDLFLRPRLSLRSLSDFTIRNRPKKSPKNYLMFEPYKFEKFE